MSNGKAVILIMRSAGENEEYTEKLLQQNTLLSSIKMPDIFKGYAGVQTDIYILDIGKKHNYSQNVKFVDFSDDGYQRSGRKAQRGQVKDLGSAKARYQELVDVIVNNKPIDRLEYLKVIEDTLQDNKSWKYNAHNKIDTRPTLDDFKKTVNDYAEWQCKAFIQQTMGGDNPYTKLVVALGLNPFELPDINSTE